MAKAFLTMVLCTVAAIGGVAGYSYAKHEAKTEALQMFYLNSALAAKTDADALTFLRSGESKKVLTFLDGMLESELITLDFYEQNLSPSDRSSQVYEDVAAVRKYYDRFPDAKRPTYGEAGLALKKKGAAP